MRHLRRRVDPEAIRPAAIVPKGRTFAPSDIMEAMAGIVPLQAINHVTRAVHAAAFWTPARGIVYLREDVGHHNALDSSPARWVAEIAAADGIVSRTSRVWWKWCQRPRRWARPSWSRSAPTALAVRTADAAGITLAAIARSDGFEVFTHPERVSALRMLGWAAPMRLIG